MKIFMYGIGIFFLCIGFFMLGISIYHAFKKDKNKFLKYFDLSLGYVFVALIIFAGELVNLS